ncbi:MAG: BAX inhibitor protein [Candidatus Sedimenticola endophacoides]|uniref:BAX inhibitor protein n=1 Tax=Candidatus Sedimenticola endophacoides TaxID=2548426 RepID=A0A6N4DSA6_9GAMM|nr:MAG: BAX inhibitor protein [Candidatus Sedimenticola endophacoides]OQX35115.1 MAG: BAX inhibitor protein [Candidatus Sedimenticola endophacoides]OQX41318.1 MAG: BAX inhibitor protein [Candidatus Sedimenticola endophacoides]OQX42658.1 MAG: BAX inhibitor protein [Candidatus Sedimenticola endophacoides]PUD99254.1 MAG: BAX inhibitor protein [Candidatus Sedimenticola endophacoides]
MNRFDQSIAQPAGNTLAVNKVIRNTYMLLSATLVFSAVMATVSIATAMPPMTYLVSLIVSMLLGMFVLPRTANSASGIGVIFLITGLMGFGLGAVLSLYLQLPHGPQTIATALGGTGVIFLGLSGYALTSRRDFSFMGGFIFSGMMVMMVAIIANLFLQMPALQLAIAGGVMLLMSGYILFQTSQMMNGGETNYINATYGLYIAIFNIFISLLQLLGIFGDD